MFRRVLLATGALALVVSASAGMGSGVAAAAPPPIQFSGPITCAVTGSAKFSPSLVNGGAAPATVKVKAKLGGCTDAAESGVTITGGTMGGNHGDHRGQQLWLGDGGYSASHAQRADQVEGERWHRGPVDRHRHVAQPVL